MDGANGQTSLQDRSIGELLRQLSEQTATLVRQELELAKAELTEKGKQAGVGVGMLSGAALVGLLALAALTTCFIAALATGMEVWVAALIVAMVYAAITGVLAVVGRARTKQATPVIPEQTVETLKEDVQWASNQARSVRR